MSENNKQNNIFDNNIDNYDIVEYEKHYFGEQYSKTKSNNDEYNELLNKYNCLLIKYNELKINEQK